MRKIFIFILLLFMGFKSVSQTCKADSLAFELNHKKEEVINLEKVNSKLRVSTVFLIAISIVLAFAGKQK